MNSDVLDRLPDFVLGTLEEAERRDVQTLIERSVELQRQVARVGEALATAAVSLAPLRPSTRGRERLLETLMTAARFGPFVDALAHYVDLSADTVRTLLSRIDDPAAWEPGPLPFIHLIHFAAGAHARATDAGFVRLAAIAAFPRHRHLGRELTMVLEGALRDGSRLYFPGDVFEKESDTVHDYIAGPERNLVIMVAHNGIVPA